MGSVCCCLSVNDFEDYMNPNSPVYRNCGCLSSVLQNFLNAYASIFHRGEMQAIPSSIQGAASMTSTASLDNSLSDMYRSPPRPMPYDADPRHFRSQHDRLVSRRDKGSSHVNDEAEPLRGDLDEDDQQSLTSSNKWHEIASEDGSKEYHSKSLIRLSSAKPTTGVGLVYSSSEEEDCCPTCLEEYTEENPKIVTKCSHHFHLGCIYEWMERSDTCPVCGKTTSKSEGREWDLTSLLNWKPVSGDGI
ncbi:E3 ubiquitin-protein ligase At3g02290 isoform X1 [Arachis hypogaea]|uniref:E3 ubiquitin-protein ligase At3g02290 isoform X1 n=1 Tax=Arachis hypogaea TaxID=3818 RepID=UPI000DECD4DF|nr:E3 ubiquitin-protein ligase At3g02290 isoform X2 [Arachis hypogaea]